MHIELLHVYVCLVRISVFLVSSWMWLRLAVTFPAYVHHRPLSSKMGSMTSQSLVVPDHVSSAGRIIWQESETWRELLNASALM